MTPLDFFRIATEAANDDVGLFADLAYNAFDPLTASSTDASRVCQRDVGRT
jgi:hypothetical protein